MGALPRSACSGDIQRGEPMACVCVPDEAPLASRTSLAMPKSRIFAVNAMPSRRGVARKMFSGFRSRCTRPILWALPSAWQIWRKTSSTSLRVRRLRCARTFLRSSPFKSSIAIHGVLVSGSMPAPTISTM